MGSTPTIINPQNTGSDTAKRFRPRRVVYGVLAVAAVLLLAMVGAVFWLDSRDGHRVLIDLARDQARDHGYDLTVAGVDGSLFGTLTIASITLTQQDQTVFRGDALMLSWHPGALWSRQVQIEALTAERLLVAIPPAQKPVEAPPQTLAQQLEAAQTAINSLNLPVGISLDQLSVGTLALAREASAAPLALTINGTVNWPRLFNRTRKLNLSAQRLDGAGEADIALGYDAHAGQLSVEAVINMPDAAAMAALTGLAHSLSLSLSGQGSLEDWRGRLTGALTGLATLDADIVLQRDGDGIALTSAPLVRWLGEKPEPLQPMIATDIQMNVDAQLSDDALLIRDLSARSGALVAQITGRVVTDDLPASTLRLDAMLSGRDDGYAVLPDFSFGGVTVGGYLAPRADQQALGLTITADTVTQGDYAVDAITLDLAADSLGALLAGQDQSLIWALALEGMATDNPAIAPILTELGPMQSLGGRVDIVHDTRGLNLFLDAWRVFDGELVAAAALTGGRLGEAALDLTDIPLGKVLALTGAAEAAGMVDGVVALQLRAVPADDDNFGLNAALTLSAAQYQDPRLTALFGENPTLTVTTANIHEPMAVELAGDALTLQAMVEGVLTAQPRVAYDLAITDAGRLHGALGGTLALTGAIVRTGDVLDITAAMAPLDVAGQRLVADDFSAALDLAAQELRGAVLAARYGDLPVGITIPRLGWGGEVRVEQAVIDLADGGARSSLSGTLTADGGLDWVISGAAVRDGIIGLMVPDASIDLLADWNLRLTGTTTAPNLVARVNDMTLRQGVRGLERGQLDVTLEPDAVGHLGLMLRLDGQLVEPAMRKPLTLVLTGVQGDAGVYLLSDLRLDYGDLPVRLLGPTTLTQTPNSLALADTRLAVAGQELRVSGQYGAARVSADLSAASWLLEPLMAALNLPEIEGQFDLTASLNATRQSVDMKSSFALSSVTMAAVQRAGLPVYDLTAEMGWDGRAFSVTAMGQDRAGQAPMRVDLTLPLRAERHQTSALSGARIPPDEALAGRINGSVDMALANQIVEASGHRLTGSMLIDLVLAGTVDRPGLSGAMTMQGATYRNLLHGIAFDGIDVRMAGSLDGLTVEQLRAEAVNGGTIEGQGSIRFGEDAPLDLKLSFNNAQMVQSDLADLILEGNVGVAGRLPVHDVSGELTITQAEIRIPRRLPQSVATLTVEEVRSSTADQEPAAVDPVTTNLDIRINAPDRLFVRGLGLDMTLGGGINVTGTAVDPSISGGFDLVQGRLDVAGQTWNFNRGGLVFNDQGSPELDVAASRDVGDITAIIAVEGPVSGPAISLTSEPPMAQGEIASRILFGQGMGNVSAVQAVQATELLATLQGNSGRGVLGTARETLGIDQLSVDQTADGASVSAGTFLGDGVFIGVNQGVGDVGSEVEIEVDITDTIKFEGTTGNRNNSRVGISVEWDY